MSKPIEVVIETPRGCRNKYKYDESSGEFSLSSVLPAGFSFPYDFGFVPGTHAGDGDPLDILILMDEPAFPGCRVLVRLLGVLEAEQTEDGETVRNDRVIAVADDSHDYEDIKTIDDLSETRIQEIERFFISYNETRGKKFRVLGCRGPKRARQIIADATVDHGD